MRARTVCVLASLLFAFLMATPAPATFHLMSIVEVFPGTPASPQAQYVVLQMYAAGQNLVNGHSIIVYNAAGTAIGTFPFSGNVGNGANQAKILIATTQAQSFFSVTADLTMTAVIPAAGGKVCFDSIDCVAWGNYTGSSAGVGTPFNQSGGGLRLTRAIKRNLGLNSTLESSDDTNNCAVDFAFATPAPRNNSNQNGTIPPSNCGNGTFDGLEECDDANGSNTDACLNTCIAATCGDGFTQVGVEQCDDTNGSNTDACLNSCQIATCGDGFIRTGVEQCDDTNGSNTDACLNSCQNATCGDGFVRTGVEQCDDANGSNTDACLNSCQNATCGDGFIRTGVEQCDDANSSNVDACLNTCQDPTCGDGFVRTGVEECDDANASNQDACVENCINASCGDGFVRTGVEQCDDTNSSNEDACLTTCLNATCGDGFVRTGVEECDDGNTTGGDKCSATCGLANIPQEASAAFTLRAARGAGSSVDVIYTPACGATQHVVYWGLSPIGSGLTWSSSTCAVGTSGAVSFDPGTPSAGQLLYFVIVGYNSSAEGSYGLDHQGAQRPEASGVGACDRPLVLGGACE